MSDLLDATSWAVTEFADADLGDLRRTQRLVQRPMRSPSGPVPHCLKPVAAAQCSKPPIAFSRTTILPPTILCKAILRRPIAASTPCPLSLAVQDTTEANWTNLRVTEGLGPLGHPACHGLLVHTTLAITPERVPLGLLAQQVWARDPDDIGKRARRKQLPISQKESQKWLHSLDAVYTARDCCPTTRLISVGDREADVYDVLAAPRPAGVDLLIRASWNRCVNAPQRYGWDTVAAQPVAAQILLHVPRRGPQPAREATLALRFCPLTLRPPQHRKAEGLPGRHTVGRPGL